ncbi:MAG: winged helix-turn-helix transcriptional regulator [Clostridia bacterium]|nr:winged helix-turn-helix transcriptional regulator [Clostridia bacterium]
MINRFEQFSASISNIYKAIQKIERAEMAKFHLRGPHVQCLVALLRNPDGLSLTRLGDTCEKDKAAISRAISELEQKGLVYRAVSPERSYRTPILLTEAGQDVSQRISAVLESAVEEAGQGLAAGERETLYYALEKIEANLRKISETGVKG